MEQTINIKTSLFSSRTNTSIVCAIFIFSIIPLTILQDYIYSELQHTGFYLSESITYNTFWAFFIPIGFLAFKNNEIYTPKNNVNKIIYTLGLGALYSMLHILLFTSLFIAISNIFFNPPHRFSTIFKSALSNQFYIIFIVYSIGPFVYQKYLELDKNKSKQISKYVDLLNLKIGSTIKPIKTSSILFITTDNPYSAIHISDERYLQDKSLRDFENELDPFVFLRVHRSFIVNKNFIREMVSRKNGDYDVVLENGKSIRFSRHYRKNWNLLLL